MRNLLYSPNIKASDVLQMPVCFVGFFWDAEAGVAFKDKANIQNWYERKFFEEFLCFGVSFPVC